MNSIILIVAAVFVLSLGGVVYRVGIDRFYRCLYRILYPPTIIISSLIIATLGQRFLAPYFDVERLYSGYSFWGLCLVSVMIQCYVWYQSGKEKLPKNHPDQSKTIKFYALVSNQAGEYLLIQSDDNKTVSILGGEIDYADDEDTLLQSIDTFLYEQAGINCFHTGTMIAKPVKKKNVWHVSFIGVDDTDAYCHDGQLIKVPKERINDYAKMYNFKKYMVLP